MKTAKKIFALLICIQLMLLACVSCGDNGGYNAADADYSKFNFPKIKNPESSYITPSSEEEFDTYLDDFIGDAKIPSNLGYDYIWLNIYINDTESDKKDYWGLEQSGVHMRLKIKFENIHKDELLALSADEKVEKIVFEYSNYYTGFVPAA